MKVTREDATAVAQLVRAWESAQERVRINRGRPLPGTLRPTAAKSKLKTGRKEPEPVFVEAPPCTTEANGNATQ